MPDPQKEMLIRWFEEVWNQGRREVIDELLSPDCVIHDGAASVRGSESFKEFFDRMRGAFSDIHITFGDALTEGDLTCLRWSVTMRHTGDALGLPPTGKQVQTTGMSLVRFSNGRFSEAWQNWDMLGIMEQIHGTPRSATYMGSR